MILKSHDSENFISATIFEHQLYMQHHTASYLYPPAPEREVGFNPLFSEGMRTCPRTPVMRDRLGSDSRALTGAFMHQAHSPSVLTPHTVPGEERWGGLRSAIDSSDLEN